MDPRPTPSLASLIAAAGLGALAMYVLDPQSGRRRVARARRLAHEAGDAAGTGWRDLRDRVSADVRQRLHRDTPTDRALEQRVRDELGRWVTHPHAARVRARDGAVVLSGCVLAAERAQLQRAVEGVKGVERVELRLAVIDTPDGMPSTPGDGARGDAQPPSPIEAARAGHATARHDGQRRAAGQRLRAARRARPAAVRRRHGDRRRLGAQRVPHATRWACARARPRRSTARSGPSADAQDAPSGDVRRAADGERSASSAAG